MSTISNYLKLMRFHKPIGILLLLWPTLWAVWTAGQGHPSLKIIIIFTLGVIVMRAAGCVINDIADRNFDIFVSRTKDRPLTSGDVSVKQAIILFCILLFLAFLLLIQLNYFTIVLGFVALGLACLYPFTKRFLYYPQLFLGLAFGMSIPMAFTAQPDALPPLSGPLAGLMFLVGILWPLMYDTEYAMVDRADDLNINIKSTAILFKQYDKLFIALLQIILLILMYITGVRVGLIFIAGLFGYQQYLIKDREPKKCFQAFLNNQWVGLILFLGSILHG